MQNNTRSPRRLRSQHAQRAERSTPRRFGTGEGRRPQASVPGPTGAGLRMAPPASGSACWARWDSSLRALG
eukprot:9109033-Alexandrium_andersonii.AAC.1